MAIHDLLTSGANVTIAVTPMELREFAFTIMEETKSMMKAESEKQQKDAILSVREAASQLGVTKNTMWRWEKSGYLVPCSRVGNSPRYLQSQIDSFLKGGAV